MHIKEINKLKRKMNKECEIVINKIIEQMIANEVLMKAAQEDPNAKLQAISLELKIMLTVRPAVGSDFSIGNHQSLININKD